ncbi:MAG: glycosyltransferase family 4 protein [Desulfuromonadaceae bacterium]|nr:glycosyltransferase family 4 protein [Desulfuromonadaceae bacterium]
MKNTVFVLNDHYLPGYKAGGPIRTISNIVFRLSDHVDFKVITGDRDLGDNEPYSGITIDAWSRGEYSEILYLSPGLRSIILLCRVLITSHYDTLYLNSLFSRKFTMLPLLLFWLKLIPCRQVIVATRGSCATSALGIKRLRKLLFLRIARLIGLFKHIVWHASSEHEAADIINIFGLASDVYTVSAPVVIASDMPALMKDNLVMTRQKHPGAIRIIFLGRIAKMKNLDYALSLFHDLKGDVIFDIYGPSEDKLYWEECTKKIDSLPQNIKVRYCGMVEHDKVNEIFKNYHALLLPTLGENFGHVILEALASGCPVIISNRTPWRNLEIEGIGWDIPLEQVGLFKEALQRCVDMNQADFNSLSEQSMVFSKKIFKDDKIVQKYFELFCPGDNKTAIN